MQGVAGDGKAAEQYESDPRIGAASDVALLESPRGPGAQEDRAVHAHRATPAQVRIDAACHEHETQGVEAQHERDQADDDAGRDAGPHFDA